MSYQAIDDYGRVVTVRKMWRCEWCNEPIPIGTKGVVRTYKYLDEFVSARMHLECKAAMGRYYAQPSIYSGDEFEAFHMPRGKVPNGIGV